MPNSEEHRADLWDALADLGSERKTTLFKKRLCFEDNNEALDLDPVVLAALEETLTVLMSRADAQSYLHERVLLAKRFVPKVD
jgi:hypothetical protein